MKTAIQELIDELENKKNQFTEVDINTEDKHSIKQGEMINEIFKPFYNSIYDSLIGILKNKLVKEKEQIADAFRNGSTSSMLGGGHWTQYYNQTYNHKKEEQLSLLVKQAQELDLGYEEFELGGEG
jgi:coenzyme F420-reducing hydrogenase delta subunit